MEKRKTKNIFKKKEKKDTKESFSGRVFLDKNLASGSFVIFKAKYLGHGIVIIREARNSLGNGRDTCNGSL